MRAAFSSGAILSSANRVELESIATIEYSHTMTGKVEQWRKFAIVGQLARWISEFVEEAVRARLQWIETNKGGVVEQTRHQVDHFRRTPSAKYLRSKKRASAGVFRSRAHKHAQQ